MVAVSRSGGNGQKIKKRGRSKEERGKKHGEINQLNCKSTVFDFCRFLTKPKKPDFSA